MFFHTSCWLTHEWNTTRASLGWATGSTLSGASLSRESGPGGRLAYLGGSPTHIGIQA